MAWVVADLEREGRPAWARLVGRADPVAMAACDRGWYRLEAVPRRLRDLAVPLLVPWGERELQGGEAALLPGHARLVVVPGEDHVGAFLRSDVLLPELRAFFVAGQPALASATG